MYESKFRDLKELDENGIREDLLELAQILSGDLYYIMSKHAKR